jgi:hypothetical protein
MAKVVGLVFPKDKDSEEKPVDKPAESSKTEKKKK